MAATPKKLKEALGTANVTRERRNLKDPHGYYIEGFDPPDWLTPRGKEIFDRLFPQLNNLEILREEDWFAFSQMCDCLALYVTITAHLNAGGDNVDNIVTETIGGGAKSHPFRLQQQRSLEKSLELSAKFHITPAVRAQLNFKFDGIGNGKRDVEGAAGQDFSDI